VNLGSGGTLAYIPDSGLHKSMDQHMLSLVGGDRTHGEGLRCLEEAKNRGLDDEDICSTGWTVEFWAKITSQTRGTFPLFSRSSVAFTLKYSTDTSTFSLCADRVISSNPVHVPVDEWFHLALRSDLSTHELRLDGQTVLETSQRFQPVPAEAGLTFGPASGLQLTEVRVWAVFRTNEQLTEQQRQPLSTHTKEEERADALRRMRIRPVDDIASAPPPLASFTGLTQLLSAPTETTSSRRKTGNTKTNLELEDKIDILFNDAPYHVVDHRHFIAELLAQLQALGATNTSISKLQVTLREGSIIADVKGPASDIADIKKLPLNKLEVLGYSASSGAFSGFDSEWPALTRPRVEAVREFGPGFAPARRNSERGEDSVDTPSIASEDLRASTHGVRRLADLDAFDIDEESDSDDSEPSRPIKGKELSTVRVRPRPKPAPRPQGLLEALPPPRPVEVKLVKATDESMQSGVTALEKCSYNVASASFRAAVSLLSPRVPRNGQFRPEALSARIEAATAYSLLCALLQRSQELRRAMTASKGAQTASKVRELCLCWACVLRVPKAPRHTARFGLQAMANFFTLARNDGGWPVAGLIAATLLDRCEGLLSAEELKQARYVQQATGTSRPKGDGSSSMCGSCPRCRRPLAPLSPECGFCGTTIGVCHRNLVLCDLRLAATCSLCAATVAGTPRNRGEPLRIRRCFVCGTGDMCVQGIGEPLPY